MDKHIFTAVLHKEEEFYVAECPEVGTVRQGHTVEEAISNLKESTELYLEEFVRKLNNLKKNFSLFILKQLKVL